MLISQRRGAGLRPAEIQSGRGGWGASSRSRPKRPLRSLPYRREAPPATFPPRRPPFSLRSSPTNRLHLLYFSWSTMPGLSLPPGPETNAVVGPNPPAPQSLLDSYARLLIAHHPFLASAESAIRSATYLLPGRFDGAEVAAEAGEFPRLLSVLRSEAICRDGQLSRPQPGQLRPR